MQFRRPESAFLLSKQIQNRESIFYQEFKKVFKLQSDINPNFPEELTNELKEFLKQLETLVDEPISNAENDEFENNFNSHIFKDFNDLNQQIMVAAETGIRLNWNNFFPKELARNDPELAEILLQEENEIVDFYNFLTNFINKDQLLRLLSTIVCLSQEIMGNTPVELLVIGITNSLDTRKYVPMTALYVSNKLNGTEYINEPALKKDLITNLSENFMNGSLSSSTKFAWFNILGHEMGHIIHAFFVLIATDTTWFGKKMDQNNFNEFLRTPEAYSFLWRKQELLNNKFNHISAYLLDFMELEANFNSEMFEIVFKELNKKGFKFDGQNNEDKKNLAYLVALPSLYGRISHLSAYQAKIAEKKEIPALEYFAEAFAYWALTPKKERNFYWGIFNKFFKKWFSYFKE